MQVVSGAVCLHGRSRIAREILRQEPHMMSNSNNKPRQGTLNRESPIMCGKYAANENRICLAPSDGGVSVLVP